jgi:hypothetical protein
MIITSACPQKFITSALFITFRTRVGPNDTVVLLHG